MKRYQILHTVNICGNVTECLCTKLGCAIVYGRKEAEKKVKALHEAGFTSARYEELTGRQWFD